MLNLFGLLIGNNEEITKTNQRIVLCFGKIFLFVIFLINAINPPIIVDIIDRYIIR